MLTIRINDFPVKMRIGVYPEERESPQDVIVSLRMDLSHDVNPGQSDDLQKTLDYGAVMGCIAEVLHEKEYQLVETVANVVGELIMGTFTQVENVHVTVTKQKIPLSFARNATFSVEQSFCRQEGNPS